MSFRALNKDIEEVLIIDLLPEDERKAWQISDDVRIHLHSLGVPQLQMSCFYKKHVFQALDNCLARLKDANFILQFTAHGNTDGLGVKSTNEFIAWAELRDALQKINRGMNGDLIVNMIACQGIEGVKVQDLDNPEDPFFGIVGPLIKIDPSLAKTVCKRFYEKMLSAVEIPRIVADINTEQKQQVLWCHSAQLRRRKQNPSLAV